MRKKGMILEYKLCSSDLDVILYRSSYSEKITTNYQKKTIGANGKIYSIFKPNKFRDVQNIYQDKASMDMTLGEIKYLTSTCWNKNYQPLKIDMTKDIYTGRYRLGLNSIFVPISSPF